MLPPFGFTAGRSSLFEPPEAVAMSGAGNDVIQAVAVHVVRKHIGNRASLAAVQVRRMKSPFTVRNVAFPFAIGLLPPTGRRDHVISTIAIHIADAKPMRKSERVWSSQTTNCEFLPHA